MYIKAVTLSSSAQPQTAPGHRAPLRFFTIAAPEEVWTLTYSRWTTLWRRPTFQYVVTTRELFGLVIKSFCEKRAPPAATLILAILWAIQYLAKLDELSNYNG